MTNQLFTPYRENMLGSGTRVDLDADIIKSILVDAADYTFSAAHDFLNDVAAGARVATSPALTNKTITSGTFDADDYTFTAVTGDQAEYLIYYDDTPGTEATKQLILFLDTFTSGMPVTPNGGDIAVQLHASGIYTVG
jgi:hypothetical protein